jgi:hypothetical protein
MSSNRVGISLTAADALARVMLYASGSTRIWRFDGPKALPVVVPVRFEGKPDREGFNDVGFDGRATSVARLAPGDEAVLALTFLAPHLVTPYLRVGARFTIHDGPPRVTGEGEILEVRPRVPPTAAP